jgi:hypothetical protein
MATGRCALYTPNLNYATLGGLFTKTCTLTGPGYYPKTVMQRKPIAKKKKTNENRILSVRGEGEVDVM